jgi:single-stranded-DNA-specific exonuclease
MNAPGSSRELTLAREMGLSHTVARVLAARGFEPDERLKRWLEPKLGHLTAPDKMADLEAATARIARALRNKERIVVFGDYDCDGITATAILTEALTSLGGEVRPELANRFAGGYGLSRAALARVQGHGASLLITADCGSSDHERLEAARKVGIDAVVIDHHLVPKETLPAVAFLNPHRPDCGHPEKGLASCGLAIMVAAALRRQLGANLDVRRWLDLCAVGTIADVAPLTGDNRALVHAGLKVLATGARVGLAALAVAGAGGRRVAPRAEGVAFQVAPRINAPGRLGDPRLALACLTERDAQRAWDLAARIEEKSLERRAIQRQITAAAVAEIEAKGFARDPAIVLARQDWHVGVVGIVAGRIAELFGKPTIVVALEGASGRGSARAPRGFRLYDSLVSCREALLGFGGHQAAAGIELAATHVERFRDAWNQACADQLATLPPPPPRGQADVALDPRDDLDHVLVDMERLEPCGEANPAPKLALEAEVVRATELREHLKLELTVGSPASGGPRALRGFGPDLAPLAPKLAGRVRVVGRLRRDHYAGGGPELLVDAIERAEG